MENTKECTMIISSCPLRVSLFGGSTDNPHFVNKFGYGSVISFTCDLKTYVTLTQDKFGFNKDQHKYIINYSRREEVSTIQEIQNDVVRVVLEHFDMPPIQVTLTSDAYSQGSGLASSSSYIISLIKSCILFLSHQMTDIEICKLAYELELKINPYCGYQDPYGCGIGGFKHIEFIKSGIVKYNFLSTKLFDLYDTHLVFTGITRNSKNVLKDISENIDKARPLLDTLNVAYFSLIENEYQKFLNYLNQSWTQKKKTSSIITENLIIKEIDSELNRNETVIAHKLCGAGNGGFFLVFSEKEKLNISYQSVRINITPNGISGIKV
jgi:D-glycero-alpha-D-manno-heptose-7-phosphate kinase